MLFNQLLVLSLLFGCLFRQVGGSEAHGRDTSWHISISGCDCDILEQVLELFVEGEVVASRERSGALEEVGGGLASGEGLLLAQHGGVVPTCHAVGKGLVMGVTAIIHLNPRL